MVVRRHAVWSPTPDLATAVEKAPDNSFGAERIPVFLPAFVASINNTTCGPAATGLINIKLLRGIGFVLLPGACNRTAARNASYR